MAQSPKDNPASDPAALERYCRQMMFAQMGVAGQRKLSAGRVLLIGCGGLGSVLADMLVRAGVGYLRIVDRDFVELNNLQRQVLFNERDVDEGLPKAVIAAQRLGEINSQVAVEPVVADVHAGNIESLLDSIGLVLDGTDNLPTRFLINDATVKHRIPWVYGACVAAEGMVLPILPGVTPCLACVWDRPPPPGLTPSCAAVGVIAPIVHLVASYQAVAAMQILTGRLDALNRRLLRIDAWTGEVQQIDLQAAFDQHDCPCCKRGRYEYLSDSESASAVLLCGREAVQIRPERDVNVDFEELARRIAPGAKGPPRINRYLMQFEIERYAIALFRDGRAIIRGTRGAEEARAVYARYVGR